MSTINQFEQVHKNDVLIAQLCDDPRYTIHPCGKIETTISRNGQNSPGGFVRLCTQMPMSRGYLRICYLHQQLMVHRIIYRKFIGKLNPNLQINHIDGNTQNNSVQNLELVTDKENKFHSYKVLKRARKNSIKKMVDSELARG